MTAPRKEALHGRWVHSHEEDSEEEAVFRPAAHPMPPSRGRRALDLRPDGSYVETYPGPVDVPEEAGGRWSLEGERLLLRPEGDRPREEWRVVAAEAERLRLERVDPAG